MLRGLIIFLISLLSSASFAQEKKVNSAVEAASRELTPLPRTVLAPEGNLTTAAKVGLGQKLFFDPRLSGNNKMSCATCHMPDKAFADGLTLTPGTTGKRLERNTQTCLNVGFMKNLFWDGRVRSLEVQALIPIRSPVEMNQPLDDLEVELAQISGYVAEFNEVFGAKPKREDIARALAAFQRTLTTGPSAFDRFLMGEKDALSAEAKTGFELFRGEAGCVECHNGPLLSDNKFYRLGVAYKDEGRFRVTGKEDDRFRFRTPSLRNIAETGPYMHDGSQRTLDDVVMFYYRGVPTSGPDGLRPEISALLGESFSDMPFIVEFLKSLTGKVPQITPPKLP